MPYQTILPCKLNTTCRTRYYRHVTTPHIIDHNNDRYIACTPINQQTYINNIYTYQDRLLELYGFRDRVERVDFNSKRLVTGRLVQIPMCRGTLRLSRTTGS